VKSLGELVGPQGTEGGWRERRKTAQGKKERDASYVNPQEELKREEKKNKEKKERRRKKRRKRRRRGEKEQQKGEKKRKGETGGWKVAVNEVSLF